MTAKNVKINVTIKPTATMKEFCEVSRYLYDLPDEDGSGWEFGVNTDNSVEYVKTVPTYIADALYTYCNNRKWIRLTSAYFEEVSA